MTNVNLTGKSEALQMHIEVFLSIFTCFFALVFVFVDRYVTTALVAHGCLLNFAGFWLRNKC